MNGHLLVSILAAGAAMLYVVAGTLQLKNRIRPARTVWTTAFALTASIVVINWIAAGEAPFANIYHVLTVLSFCFLPLCLYLEKRFGLDMLRPVFMFGAAVPLVGTLFMKKQVAWQKPPALQSIWFIPHVFAYMIAYSLAFSAFLLACITLVRRHKKQETERWEKAVYQVTKLAFPFFTFGMLIGAVWAESAWGVYWSWDIKETWALITWVLYLLYFHCRSNPARQWAARAAQFGAFFALTITFVGVSYLPLFASGLHSYL